MQTRKGSVMSQHTSPFDAIRRIDESGNEYWSARELSKLLGYKDWRNFTKAIAKAMEACEQSGRAASGDFGDVTEIVKAGATSKPREDYHLSRYACYLIIQNADPSKPIVALGQTYFAVQTRRQEIADELAADMFRATQTDAKLRRQGIQGKNEANQTHLEIGKIVRKAI